MKFIANQVYHIFNQGNNKQQIFFQNRNYDYFLFKMEKHLLPYVDVIAYCLMPNHFHWLVRTKVSACENSKGYKPIGFKELASLARDARDPQAVELTMTDFMEKLNRINRQQNLCHEIGQLLSSYAKAVNRQEGRSGSLFRKRTKAKNGLPINIEEIDLPEGITIVENSHYQKICFDYIHLNPVKAGFVDHAEDWPFSSAVHYLINVSTDLCNIDVAAKLGILSSSSAIINK